VGPSVCEYKRRFDAGQSAPVRSGSVAETDWIVARGIRRQSMTRSGCRWPERHLGTNWVWRSCPKAVPPGPRVAFGPATSGTSASEYVVGAGTPVHARMRGGAFRPGTTELSHQETRQDH